MLINKILQVSKLRNLITRKSEFIYKLLNKSFGKIELGIK